MKLVGDEGSSLNALCSILKNLVEEVLELSNQNKRALEGSASEVGAACKIPKKENSFQRHQDRGCHLSCAHARCRTTWKPSLLAHRIEPADLQRGKH